MAVCVTHDWNLYLLRTLLMDPDMKYYEDVAYLDGIVFYEKGGRIHTAHHQIPPTPVNRTNKRA